MAMVVLTVAILLGVSSPGYQEYLKHSNGNAAFSIGFSAPCTTGLRNTGYAYAPARFIMFKQKPLGEDEAGAVCEE